MSTPGGSERPDRPYDPTAPTPSVPADSPLFQSPSSTKPTTPPNEPTTDAPSYPAYEAEPYQPDSYAPPSPPDASIGYAPPDPAEGWYLAPPPASALPPLPGETSPSGPTYPPTSGYPSPPAGPVRTSQRALLAVVLGLVVIVGLALVGVAVVFRAGTGDRPVAGPTLPTFPSSAPSGSATTGSTPSGPRSASEVTVPAVTPGFTGALSPKEDVVYDVPPGWEIRTPGTLVGFEDNDGNPVAIMHGVSTYRREACPNVSGSNRGSAGFATAGNVEPAQAAQNGVELFADAAALNEDGSSAPVSLGPLVDVEVAQGTITAKMATATLTPPADASCGAPRVVFTAVAFRTPSGATALFIMYLDQGTSDALSPALADQIVASLRPHSR